MTVLHRWYYLLVAAAFVSGGYAVSIGSSAPRFPDRHVWTWLAWLTAFALVVYAIKPGPLSRPAAWSLIFGAVGARALGALFYPANTPARWGGTAVWGMTLLFAIMARRHLRDRDA